MHVYLYDYELMQVFAEAAFDRRPTGQHCYSLTTSIIAIRPTNDTGWMLGGKIGQAKDRGQMQLTYYLR